MDPGPVIAPGIHPSAVIDPTAEIGEARPWAPSSISAPAPDRANARIASHVSIAEGAQIGDDALILAGVRIAARVRIGHRVIIQPGAVLGGDGFSFVTPEQSHVETARQSLGTADHTASGPQSWTRIHSLGGLVIGDDVEIGANAAIDRGTIADTVDRRRHQDRQPRPYRPQLPHRARLPALRPGGLRRVGGAGRPRRAGRAMRRVGQYRDRLGRGRRGRHQDLFQRAPGRMLMGSPAVKLDTHVEMYKALRRLPRLARTVAELQKAVFKSDRTP
jgi:UDP-3-O-[3-hydroxymyristoyl] glucosamine N-acyltransferase